MAQFSDFINRIFSNERTQGLSGGAEAVIEADPASAFYAARMRKHRTDEDLVTSPEYVWATPSFGGRKGGLRAHLQAERGDGIANFTDVLLVINQPDARRAAVIEGEPWTERTAKAIADRFTQFCEKDKFELRYGTRPLRFWIVADGGSEMLNQGYGLGPGEFITGLVPNLYLGPARRSRPVLAVHLNLPGAWEGYREVGRIYSDQMLFTLGRHWLDNFHHPALREPGLYRLQQYPDGSLVHTISPELQHRYLVRSDQVEGGASVLTIAEWGGAPVAYLVLAVIDAPSMDTVAVEMAEATAAAAAATPVAAQVDEPAAIAPRATRSDLSSAASFSQSGATPRRTLSNDKLTKTIVPGALDARIFTLQERGALLQKVHFANYMDGYDVFIGAGSAVATQMTDPKATLQVRGGRVSLIVNDAGVRVDGQPAVVGKAQLLAGEVTIDVDGNQVVYRDLSTVKVDGWPYLGELRRAGGGTYLDFGSGHRIGRDRRCKVRLPDEPQNTNIAWLPSVGGGTTIRSHTGDIPKSRFYTDSIMVASEHAEIDLDGEPVLRSLARQCYTYVRRGNDLFPLVPRSDNFTGAYEMALQPDDEVLVGNCLFRVSFPPNEKDAAALVGPIVMPEPPPPALAPVDLDDVADAPAPRRVDKLAAADRLERTNDSSVAPAGILKKARGVTLDVPAAFGLGEAGTAPRPVQIGMAGNGDRALADLEAYTSPLDRPLPRTGPAIDERAIPDPAASIQTADRPSSAKSTRPPAGPPPPPMLLDGGGLDDPPRTLESDPETEADEPLMRFNDRIEGPSRPPVSAPEQGVEPLPPVDPDEAVLSVEEAQWQFELSRPGQLVQEGWMVSGDVVVGNHKGCGVVIPEVRAFSQQAFMTLDYFRLSVRGKRGRVELLQEGEARLTANGVALGAVDNLDTAHMEIVRRDQNLEPDFDVALDLQADPALPDPRARLLRIDVSDRLTAALFTVGLPLKASRRLRLGPIEVTATFDGHRLLLTDYITTYRLPTGFRPCFFREGTKAYRTLPEDGSQVVVSPGDTLICGSCVYRFQPA